MLKTDFKISGNNVYLINLTEKGKLPEEIVNFVSVTPFLLLFINLSSSKTKDLKGIFENIFNNNLKLFSAWGKNAPELENIVDHIDVQLHLENPSKIDWGVVTTSHPDEPLEDVLDFYINSWETLSCSNRLILIYGEDRGKTFKTISHYLNLQ